MARGNNSGNGNNVDYKMSPTSSGKVTAPFPINETKRPGRQAAGDLRMNGKKTDRR